MATEQLPRIADHAPSYHLAGSCALESRDWATALPLLQKATLLAPDNIVYVACWAQALALTDNLSEALRAANYAISLNPCDPAVLNRLGIVYRKCQANRHALDAFNEAVVNAPDNAEYRYNLAVALVQEADLDAARLELNTVIALKEDSWEAQYLLSRLGSIHPKQSRIESLRALLDKAGADHRANVYGQMAIGREHEAKREYGHALECYRMAKNAVRPVYASSGERIEGIVEAMIAMPLIAEAEAEAKCSASDDPIFVVGMPHAGLTLVERMLSTHTRVHATGACANFGMAFKSLTRSHQVIGNGRSDHSVWSRRLGERYLQSARPLTNGMPRFVDRFAHNFLYLGYIAKALPNAKIIALSRHPMDLCLATFRTLHTPNDEFFDYSLNLKSIAHYYAQYRRLMCHWQAVLPGRILEIDYEDLVHRRSDAWRQMLLHAGLPWQALSFYPEPITPMGYDSAHGRWKRFGDTLAGLRIDLERQGVAILD